MGKFFVPEDGGSDTPQRCSLGSAQSLGVGRSSRSLTRQTSVLCCLTLTDSCLDVRQLSCAVVFDNALGINGAIP